MPTNRLLEYEVPSDEELVSRILASVHRSLDEQFPNSAKSFDGSKRFAQTEFSSVNEDTIIEQNPGPATGEALSSSEVPRPEVPPPPKAKQNVPKEHSPLNPHLETSSPQSAGSPFYKGPKKSKPIETSLELPENLTSVSKPLSRTQVSTSTSTSTDITGASSSKSGKGVSLKLFSFLFAILIGLAVGCVIFLFWYR
jgi:hypothetical protein